MGSRWQKVGGVERPPITNPIANLAPIEHGPVMDYTVGDALGLRRMGEPTTFAQPIIARSMRTLAANLAVGGALCAAYWQHGDRRRWDWRPGCGRAWGGGA